MTFRNAEKLQKQFLNDTLSKKLRYVFCYAEWYAEAIHGINTLIITSIYRSEKEQKKICEKLGKKYKPSVHEFWRGIDFIMPHALHIQYIDVAKHLNGKFPYGRGRYKTALIHGSEKKGYGKHIHLQVNDTEA